MSFVCGKKNSKKKNEEGRRELLKGWIHCPQLKRQEGEGLFQNLFEEKYYQLASIKAYINKPTTILF